MYMHAHIYTHIHVHASILSDGLMKFNVMNMHHYNISLQTIPGKAGNI
jgi:hypothetical protein